MKHPSMTNKKRETTWTATEYTSTPITQRERSDTEKHREMPELCNPTELRPFSATNTAKSSQLMDSRTNNVVKANCISVETGDHPANLKHASQDYQRGLLLKRHSIQLLSYSRQLLLASSLLMHDDPEQSQEDNGWSQPSSITHKRRNSSTNYELFINDLAKEKAGASPPFADHLQKGERTRSVVKSNRQLGAPHEDCDVNERPQSTTPPAITHRRRKSIAGCQLFANDIVKVEANPPACADEHHQSERKMSTLAPNDDAIGDQHKADTASRTSEKDRSPSFCREARASSTYISHRRLKSISRHQPVDSALTETDKESCSGGHRSSLHKQDTDAQSPQPSTPKGKTQRRRIRLIPTHYLSKHSSAEKEGKVSSSTLRSPRDVQEKQQSISTNHERTRSFDMQRLPSTQLASTHHVRARSLDTHKEATPSMSYQRSSTSPPTHKHQRSRTPSIPEEYNMSLSDRRYTSGAVASVPSGDGNHSAYESQRPESARAPSSAIYHARARSFDVHPKQTNTGPSHSRARSLGDDRVAVTVSTHPLMRDEPQSQKASLPKQSRSNARRNRTKPVPNFHQPFQNTTPAESNGGDPPSRQILRAVSSHTAMQQTDTTRTDPQLASFSSISTKVQSRARAFDNCYMYSDQVLSKNHDDCRQASHNMSPRMLGANYDLPSQSDYARRGQDSDCVAKNSESVDIMRTHDRSLEGNQKKIRGQSPKHSSVPSILPKAASRKKSSPLHLARFNQKDSEHFDSLARISQSTVAFASSTNVTPNVLWKDDESQASSDASEAPPADQQHVAIMDFPPRPRQSTLLKSASWSDDDALLVSCPREIPLLSVALLDSL